MDAMLRRDCAEGLERRGLVQGLVARGCVE